MARQPPVAPRKRPPTTGAALIAQARPKNRLMAFALVGFVVTAFVLVIVATTWNHRKVAERQHGQLAHAAAPSAVR